MLSAPPLAHTGDGEPGLGPSSTAAASTPLLNNSLRSSRCRGREGSRRCAYVHRPWAPAACRGIHLRAWPSGSGTSLPRRLRGFDSRSPLHPSGHLDSGQVLEMHHGNPVTGALMHGELLRIVYVTCNGIARALACFTRFSFKFVEYRSGPKDWCVVAPACTR